MLQKNELIEIAFAMVKSVHFSTEAHGSEYFGVNPAADRKGAEVSGKSVKLAAQQLLAALKLW